MELQNGIGKTCGVKEKNKNRTCTYRKNMAVENAKIKKILVPSPKTKTLVYKNPGPVAFELSDPVQTAIQSAQVARQLGPLHWPAKFPGQGPEVSTQRYRSEIVLGAFFATSVSQPFCKFSIPATRIGTLFQSSPPCRTSLGRPPEALRASSCGPRSIQWSPTTLQDGPRAFQNASRSPQQRPRSCQKGPRCLPNASGRAPGGQNH